MVRRIARIGIWLALLAVVFEATRVLAMTNRHTVVEGKIYRCSQPSEKHIREMVKSKGIKTVLNLRGLSPEFPWYKGECAACSDLGVSQEDITLSAQSLPPPAELRRIVEVFDRTEFPVLIHCKAGADRTGLVSALYLLLYTDATTAEARRQLWPRFGHFRFGRTAAMDEFYDQYDAYLINKNIGHSRETFRHWLLHEYSPGPAKSKLEWIETPAEYPANAPITLKMKATNLSVQKWEMKPGSFAGVHASYQIYNEAKMRVEDTRGGYREQTVKPGEIAEFLLPVRSLPPGKYLAVVELHNSMGAAIPFRTNSFSKFGDGTLLAEFAVK